MKKLLALITGLALASPVANGFLGLSDANDSAPQVIKNLNENIIPGDTDLGSTLLVIKTNKDIQEVSLSSGCEHSQKLIYKNIVPETYNLFLLKINFYSSECTNNTIFIKNGDQDVGLYHANFVSTSAELEKTLDISTENLTAEATSLELFARENDTKAEALKKSPLFTDKLKSIELAYGTAWLRHQTDIRKEILKARENLSYISPIRGRSLPTRNTKMPNSPRPFRADVTDGIHHGWDVDAPVGTPIRAVGDGIIIRIVDRFAWKDFDRIIRKKSLSSYEKAENLDILRGNQVWLKTMDGNVVFLAHLSEIAPGLQVGQKVEQGDYLGKVGISGVPDKGYTDSHVHFEVTLNPHDQKDTVTSMQEMIMWSYLGKGLSKGDVIALQNSLFSGEKYAKN